MEKIFTIEEQNLSNRARPLQYKINGECWECCSHKTTRIGYPHLRRRGCTQNAHRYVYQLLKGEIPPGQVVRHTCDNKLCINPDHLILGTPQDNVNDYMERQYNVDEFKKKVREAKGEDMAYKFKKDTREEIIEDYKNGMFVKDIMKKFDISRTMVYNILRKANVVGRNK